VPGTKLLLPVLTSFGRDDLAYAVATQTEYPSWGYWVTQGATSSWETWRIEGPDQTLDHPFLGTVDDWLYQHLAGIQAAKPGYDVVRIAPVFPAQLHQVSATVTTPHGEVSSSWRRVDGVLILEARLPPGVQTELALPVGPDRVEARTGKITLLSSTGGRTVYATSATELEVRVRAST
jgi:alpha-L-rhamnosidase